LNDEWAEMEITPKQKYTLIYLVTGRKTHTRYAITLCPCIYLFRLFDGQAPQAQVVAGYACVPSLNAGLVPGPLPLQVGARRRRISVLSHLLHVPYWSSNQAREGSTGEDQWSRDVTGVLNEWRSTFLPVPGMVGFLRSTAIPLFSLV